MWKFDLCVLIVAFFGKIVRQVEKKSDYELVANEIWSKVKLVNESGDHSTDSRFINFDEFRRFWFIVRDKEQYYSGEVCVICF